MTLKTTSYKNATNSAREQHYKREQQQQQQERETKQTICKQHYTSRKTAK